MDRKFLSKRERESRLEVFAHGGGKMSMRFNQGKCCERKGKNGASVARHVTEKHARIEEARSSCNFCPHRVVSVFRNRAFF